MTAPPSLPVVAAPCIPLAPSPPTPPPSRASDPDAPGAMALNLPRPRTIIDETVGQVFGVAPKDLRSPSRGRARVALARQVSMYLAHVACGLSLSDVGQLFDRDRTTVAHACGVVEDHRDDRTFDRILELLEGAVTALLERCGTDPRQIA